MTSHLKRFHSLNLSQPLLHLIMLISIAGLMYLIFHFSVFADDDEIRYALDLMNLSKDQAEPFNYELSFGYYLALHPLVSSLPPTYLPVFLNGLNSVFGILLLIPLYFLIKSLISPRVAFLTTLFLFFSPPYWSLSRYGHPAIPALFFFISSLACFNRAINNKSKSDLVLSLSILLAVCALMIRADILLGMLAPLGLFWYKQPQADKPRRLIIIFYLLIILGYALLKWLALGYILNPTGGAVQLHIQERLPDYQTIIKSIIKNSALFIFNLLPVLVLCLLLSLIWLGRTRQWRFLTLVGLWAAPTLLVFLPFCGMAYARLAVPILPPVLFAIVYWIDNLSAARFKYVIPVIVLIIAQLFPLLTTPILTAIYPFKVAYKGRPVASVPLKPIFMSYFAALDYRKEQSRIARQVTRQTGRDVFIVSDGSHLPWYEYELFISRNASCMFINSQDILFCPTDQNRFYMLDLDQASSADALTNILADNTFKNVLFHVSPFIADLPKMELFLDQHQVATLWNNNSTLIDH